MIGHVKRVRDRGATARTLVWLVATASCLVGGRRAAADIALGWGKNNYYQVGDGTSEARYAPVPVAGLGADVIAVAAGARFGLALENGAVYSWGEAGSGALGDGNLLLHTVAQAQPVTGLSSGVTAIAAVNGNGYALQNGALYGWGVNNAGTVGDGTLTDRATPVPLPGMSDGVTALATGGGSGMLAIRNGAAYVWGELAGDGTDNQPYVPTPVPTLTSGVTSVATGGDHALVVQNGAVYAWGANWDGQLGDGTNHGHSAPAPVPGLTSGVTAVAASGSYSMALKDGQVYVWGWNSRGQLGDGTTNDSYVPEEVDPSKVNNIVAISAGNYSGYALAADGSMWVWGENYYGELGLGNNDVFLTPQHLYAPAGYRFTSVDGGDATSDLLPLGYEVLATVATPEPAGLSLLAVGAVALAARQSRRHQRAR